MADKEIHALGITDMGAALVEAGIAHENVCIDAELGVDDDAKGVYVICQTCGWRAYPHNPRDN